MVDLVVTFQTAVNDATVGANDWSSPSFALVIDGSVASLTGSFGQANSIVLFNAAAVISANKAGGIALPTGALDYTLFGGLADGWTADLSPAVCNSSTFGPAISVTTGNGTSKYLLLTNRTGDAIPDGATINGVLLEIKWGRFTPPPTSQIDGVQMTIRYTPVAGRPRSTQIGIGLELGL